MKVTLDDGRLVQIGVQFGNEEPVLVRPLPPEAVGRPFRSVRINLTIYKDNNEVGHLSGVSYCSPLDQFNKTNGRSKALKRLLEKHNYRATVGEDFLSKEDLRVLCPIIVYGPKGKEMDLTSRKTKRAAARARAKA